MNARKNNEKNYPRETWFGLNLLDLQKYFGKYPLTFASYHRILQEFTWNLHGL
uniref:Uncharacterized protein n=1 Tax=Octopus bimaculoides TaxID=37653 RepID=A0A0L8I0B8_OCTBM